MWLARPVKSRLPASTFVCRPPARRRWPRPRSRRVPGHLRPLTLQRPLDPDWGSSRCLNHRLGGSIYPASSRDSVHRSVMSFVLYRGLVDFTKVCGQAQKAVFSASCPSHGRGLVINTIGVKAYDENLHFSSVISGPDCIAPQRYPTYGGIAGEDDSVRHVARK